MKGNFLHTIATIAFVCMMSHHAEAINLFSEQARQSAGNMGIVMDFMERYFSEIEVHDAQSQKIRMYDDKVFFTEGDITDLKLVNDTMPLTITCREKHYFVKWTVNDQPFITVVFPAQFELVMGMNHDEAKKHFKNMVLDADTSCIRHHVNTDNLVTYNDSIGRSQSEYFEIESLNDASYYVRANDNWIPLFDNQYQEFSAANLMHGLIDTVDYPLHVEQSMYGGETTSYDIRLSQWINYCIGQGHKVFFAVEEVREDGILAIVIAQNRELNYNHLMSIVFPNGFIDKHQTVLKAKITPFIPTHNVKNLYQQQYTKHKRRKW